MPEQLARTTELSPAKRRQILSGARQVFTEMGCDRASVDLIAARARVSKATVYNHFHDKRGLFLACLHEEVHQMREGLRASLGEEPSGEVEHALRATGERLIAVLVSPPVVALYRYSVGETLHSPEVGRTLFERGPTVLYDMVEAYLKRWGERGVLRLDDPRSAAVQFVMLCQADVMLRAHLGALASPADALIRETVARAVQTFLRAYRA